jgi:molybdopterin-synthase adenylyltransferase
MAAAGFGKIRICDCDAVELSNLNRQILHANDDVGRAKAKSAYETLTAINPEIEVEALVKTISSGNIDQLLQGCDLIMDGMDNFPVRYLLNRAALDRRFRSFTGPSAATRARPPPSFPREQPALPASSREPLRHQFFQLLAPPAV